MTTSILRSTMDFSLTRSEIATDIAALWELFCLVIMVSEFFTPATPKHCTGKQLGSHLQRLRGSGNAKLKVCI